MTPGVLKEWLGVAALMISVGGFFYAWLTSRSKTNSEQLEQLDGRVDQLVGRLQAVELELRHMPDKETIAELRISVEGVKTRLAGMEQQASATGASVRRIEDYLLKGAK